MISGRGPVSSTDGPRAVMRSEWLDLTYSNLVFSLRAVQQRRGLAPSWQDCGRGRVSDLQNPSHQVCSATLRDDRMRS